LKSLVKESPDLTAWLLRSISPWS